MNASGHEVCGRADAYGRVERVVDGDTVIVHLHGGRGRERVRLLRVNTPEQGQRGADEARGRLRELLDKRTVTLEYETRHPDRDQYGRVLAYVCVGGTNANVEQVRSGWSKFWTKYGEGRNARAFTLAEAEARMAGRGIWWNSNRR